MNLASARGGQRHERRRRKRYGRGIGSGIGKTCARGTKGQGARSGAGIHLWSEGGQMQLWRRTTKRGFSNARHRDTLAELNVEDLKRFAPNTTVDMSALRAAKLIRGKCDGWALLGRGECTVQGLTIVANRVTATAREKITASGGQIQAPITPAETQA